MYLVTIDREQQNFTIPKKFDCPLYNCPNTEHCSLWRWKQSPHHLLFQSVFFLSDLSADLNKTDVQQVTPLHAAVRDANFEKAFALLLRGADPNICDHRGDSPLISAISVSALWRFEWNRV